MNRPFGAAIWSVAIGLSLGCGGEGTGPSGSQWSVRAPLPVPRTDHVAVSLEGNVYVLGGFSGSTLARVDAYDPAADRWTRKADMLTARRNFAAGVINGKIYASAGMSYSDPNGVTYVTETEAYDPVDDTWTALAPCPMDRATNSVRGNVSITGGAAFGHLYVMVFNTNTQGFTATYEYEPETDTWATKAPPPFSYVEYSMVDLGDRLYLLASGSEVGERVAEYDPQDDVWIIRASLSSVWWAGLGEGNGKLYAFGGVTLGQNHQPTGVLADIREYDPAGDRWSAHGAIGVPRHSARAVQIGGQMYVIGGASTPNPYSPTPVTTVETGSFGSP
jgi:N-acetylneuraminic acid mutarotase